ncbi:hypothetical protein [Sphingobium amiense]|uniref:hypothetical protein n=1 Tax=Sphingobium amiense TaxID=135719 RepID=UPI000F83A203|nr:hypothetical protein [Sphingobium amiense]
MSRHPSTRFHRQPPATARAPRTLRPAWLDEHRDRGNHAALRFTSPVDPGQPLTSPTARPVHGFARTTSTPEGRGAVS